MKAAEAARPRERTEADEEAELRAAATPMAVSDAIQRMLLAWKDRDYFRRGPLPPAPCLSACSIWGFAPQMRVRH